MALIRPCARLLARVVRARFVSALHGAWCLQGCGRLRPHSAQHTFSTVVRGDPAVDFATGVALLEDPLNPSGAFRGADLVRRAAASRLPAAMGLVGEWKLLGTHGEARDVAAALHLLYEAASAGDADAQFWCGRVLCDAAALADSGAGTDASGGGNSAPALPAPDPAAAAAVVASIRATRRVAKANKARRVQGLPLLPLPLSRAGSGASGASSSDSAASPSDLLPPLRVPLATDVGAGRAWLLRAAAQEHAGAQVALGNLAMQAAQAPPAADDAAASAALFREGLRWYELAAQLSGVVAPPPLPAVLALQGLREDDAEEQDAGPGADGGGGSSGSAGALLTSLAARRAAAPVLPPAATPTSSSAATVAAPVVAAAAASRDGLGDPPSAPHVSSPPPPPHPDALFNLGMWYYAGIPCVLPSDPARAAALFAAAADLGDAPSQLWLGHAQLTGSEAETAGIPRDPRAGMRLIELAAGAGHGPALLYLARLHRVGEPALGLPADPRRTRFFLEAAADADDADGATELAESLYFGRDGFDRDLPRARALFDAAAAAGHADAMVSAGVMALRGEGTEDARPQYARAFELYSRAVEVGGSVRAWENLAALHATGSLDDGGAAVPRNLAAARYIHAKVLPVLRLAAEGDEATAPGRGGAAAPAEGEAQRVASDARAGDDVGVIDLRHL